MDYENLFIEIVLKTSIK